MSPVISTYKLILKRTAISKKFYRRNDQIRVPEVRVIDEKGNQIGVMQTSHALAEAQSRGLDLVEVSPVAKPPVCKIVDYGQLKYEQNKKDRAQKSKQKQAEVKGIRLSVTISDHDLDVRANRAHKFLDKGHKVQIELLLRGRQKAHPEKGKEVIERFLEMLGPEVKVESPTVRKGGKFFTLIGKKK